MKIIYICSPYHAGSEKILKRNIEYAKELTREILLRGDAAITVREEMREYGDCYSDTDEAKFGKHITRLTGFIISIPAAVMWWCTPLIVAGLMIYDKIQEKNPELCGFKADDFDKEENK